MASAVLKKKPADQGYIYVYTHHADHNNVHVYNHDKQKFEPIGKAGRSRFRRLFGLSRKPKYALLKVGFTTLDPKVRLAQWQNQCGHPIEFVIPRKAPPHYDKAKCGWPCAQAHAVERAVHTQLRTVYGAGKVQCGGCAGSGGRGVHVEWFLVQRSQVDAVLALIDQIVSR